MRETKLQRARRQAFDRRVFVSVLRSAGNLVVEEHLFDLRKADRRKWRFDIALPHCDLLAGKSANTTIYVQQSIAIEIEGIGHGHLGVGAFRSNIAKYGEAFAQGWNVLRVTWKEIEDGTALDWLARCGVRVEPIPAIAENGASE